MGIYICFFVAITFITIAALSCEGKHLRKILMTISFLLLLVFSAIRKDIGIDYIVHYRIFARIVDGQEQPGIALLYSFLNSFAANFGLGFEFVVAVTTLLTLIPIYYIARREDNPLFLYLFFLVFYYPSFSLMRQCASLSFALLGTYFFVKEDCAKKGLICTAIGCLFHSSLWGYLIVLAVSRYIRIKFTYVIPSVVIFVLFAWVGKEFIFSFLVSFIEVLGNFIEVSKYIFYLNPYNRHNVDIAVGSGLGVILRIFIFTALFMVGNISIVEERKKYLFNYLFLFLLLFYGLTFQSRIFFRVQLIFNVVAFIPFFTKIVIPGSRQRFLQFWMLVSLLYVGLMVCSFIDIVGWKNIPYQTIF